MDNAYKNLAMNVKRALKLNCERIGQRSENREQMTREQTKNLKLTWTLIMSIYFLNWKSIHQIDRGYTAYQCWVHKVLNWHWTWHFGTKKQKHEKKLIQWFILCLKFQHLPLIPLDLR